MLHLARYSFDFVDGVLGVMQVFYLILIIFLLGLVVVLSLLLNEDDTQISNMLISECGSI